MESLADSRFSEKGTRIVQFVTLPLFFAYTTQRK